MGKLIYGNSGIEIEFDDRTLTHLQIVIAAKLRRRESFFFSWKDDPAVDNGRSSSWLDAYIPLYFKYAGGRVPTINRDSLEVLTASSNGIGGLQFSEEPRGPVTPATGGTGNGLTTTPATVR